mgnify:CR=1 FL=1
MLVLASHKTTITTATTMQLAMSSTLQSMLQLVTMVGIRSVLIGGTKMTMEQLYRMAGSLFTISGTTSRLMA